MKKFFMYGAIAFIVFIAIIALIPVIGILFSGLLVAAGVHFYTKSESQLGKVLSIALIIVGSVSGLSNTPGLIGLLAIAAVYYFYKGTKSETNSVTPTSNDPFTNFEREWANLNTK